MQLRPLPKQLLTLPLRLLQLRQHKQKPQPLQPKKKQSIPLHVSLLNKNRRRTLQHLQRLRQMQQQRPQPTRLPQLSLQQRQHKI